MKRIKIIIIIIINKIESFVIVTNHNFFLNEDFFRKSTKTKLLTKYIHVCTSHHQLHMQTLYIIQNELI